MGQLARISQNQPAADPHWQNCLINPFGMPALPASQLTLYVAGGKAASIPPHTWERGSAIAERSDPDTPVQEVKPWGRCTLAGRRLPCSFP